MTCVALATLTTGPVAAAGASSGPPISAVDPTPPPNIVLVLADDLDVSLVERMRTVRRLQRSGVTFDNSFVVDSLCCPSRAATLTGMVPHNTGVRINTSTPDDPTPTGGYAAFRAVEDKSFAVMLQQAGYRTAFMGKYVNGYPVVDGGPLPPGWDRWNAVGGGGYRGWRYGMASLVPTESGPVLQRLLHTGLDDADYVQTVLGASAVEFIETAAPDPAPYFLEVAPYATHSRVQGAAHPGDPVFPPALADRPSPADPDGNCGRRPASGWRDCRRLQVTDLAGFGQPTDDNRPYLADGNELHGGWLPANPLSADAVRRLGGDYRNRARMAQSVDRILADVLAASAGEPTYVIFTSDNGFRLGQFSLGPGKGTAYAPDISVPLVVGGSALPTLMHGMHRSEVVQNIDLAPTFAHIAGAEPLGHHDGSSLLPLLSSATPPPWREMAYIEHVQPPGALDDPDQEVSTNRVPTYWAVRSADALLVESRMKVGTVDSEPQWESVYEYYTGLSQQGAYEATNVYTPGDPAMEEMRVALETYKTCVGLTCRTAAGHG